MRIRSDQELFDKIDEELIWRRADLTRLRKAILDNKKSNQLICKTLLRTSIPLIYAHWEGFIKEASLAYFNFIAIRKLKFNELSKGFLALYIQERFLNTAIPDFEKAAEIESFFNSGLNERSEIKRIPEPIKTKSNLNSSVFKEIALILGIDYEKFRGFEIFLDAKLLNIRNKVAHGEYREVDWEDYDEAHNIVLSLLIEFKDQIQNNVVSKKYSKL